MKSGLLEKVDPVRYGALLANKLPTVIGSEAENERLTLKLEDLGNSRIWIAATMN